MLQITYQSVTVFRKSPQAVSGQQGAYVQMEVPREKMEIGDIVYDTNKKVYGRIVQFIFKEPGRYEDMQLEIEVEPCFRVFPVNYN